MSDSDRGMDRRQFLTLAGTGAASAALAGCTQSGGTDTTTTDGTGGTDTTTETTTTEDGMDLPDFPVTITQGQFPGTLDPHNHRNTPTSIVLLHAYEGVLTRNAEGVIQENLATDFERVEPGRVRFTIREGVSFHEGGELAPEDVAYSINRMVDEDVGIASPQASQLRGVTGAEVVDGERAVDALSDGLNPTVIQSFATYCDVVKKSWVEENDRSYVASNINGTGPFQLASFEADTELVYERNTDYWQEPADVSELTFISAAEQSTRVNQLLGGETDLIVNVPPQSVSNVRDADNAAVAAAPSTRIIFNGMRTDVEPFDSQKFRLAMNYAIDLESIVKNALGGFGAQTGQPVLEGFVGHDPETDPFPYDPDRAERLVNESGYDGAEITLDTPVGRYLNDLQIAQSVAGFIDELPNVSASVQQRDFGDLAGELTTGSIKDKPPWFLIGWGEATFDGGLVMAALIKSDGLLATIKNDEIDSLLEEARTQQGDARDATLQEASAMTHDLAPWIFLNRQFSVYGTSSRIDWTPRRDERIDAYAISPSSSS